jgi:leucyl-tRNA synthetase
MPQWAGSCWYYLRYLDTKNSNAFCSSEHERYWMPVDLYVGGAEHAVLHLLYSRFWHKLLYDRGYVHTPEPFMKLVNQGMILGEAKPFVYLNPKKMEEMVSAQDAWTNWDQLSDKEITEEEVETRGEKEYYRGTEIVIFRRADKMSKSRGNVINPDIVVDKYGADSMRLYEMFMGPLEATKPWSMRGVEGVYRFLGRVWRLIVNDRADEMKIADAVSGDEPDRETLRKLHQTIKKVTEDLDGMRFNTAISAMMELCNHLTKLDVRPKPVLETFVLLLSPFAPHLGEELWSALGHTSTLAYEPWPSYDESLTQEDTVEIPVQINGKLRSKLQVPAGIDKETLEKTALADERIRSLLGGKPIRKVIVVQGKLVNIVVSG